MPPVAGSAREPDATDASATGRSLARASRPPRRTSARSIRCARRATLGTVEIGRLRDRGGGERGGGEVGYHDGRIARGFVGIHGREARDLDSRGEIDTHLEEFVRRRFDVRDVEPREQVRDSRRGSPESSFTPREIAPGRAQCAAKPGDDRVRRDPSVRSPTSPSPRLADRPLGVHGSRDVRSIT